MPVIVWLPAAGYLPENKLYNYEKQQVTEGIPSACCFYAVERQVNRPDVEKTITEYLKPIFGFALKRCKSIYGAENLLQEIAVRAFRALLIKEDVADMGKFI